MTKKRIRTMEQFAEAVGLSRPTVSKYFQDADSVRAKVRERIEAGLRETSFRPNLFAVNLNRRRSKIIGLIFPTSLDPFYMDLQRRITIEAGAAGYLPFVFSSDGEAELEAEAIETLTSMNVAGIIMTPVGGDDGHRATVKALAHNIPIIFADVPFDSEEAFVGTNNAQSMALIADYLTRVGEPPCYFDMPNLNSNAGGRRGGYIATMHRRGLQPIVIPLPAANSWEFERFGFENTMRILREGGFPTRTVLCANDRVAFGVMAAAQQSGLRIGIEPDCDLRVAGHDNQPLSQYCWPPLTTVQQNTAEMARHATTLLLSRLEGGRPADDQARHILIDADLVLRASA